MANDCFVKTEDRLPAGHKVFVEAEEGFRDLLNSANPAFLLGAGCSKVASLPLIDELTSLILDDTSVAEESRSILESVKNSFAVDTTLGKAHIEDFLSELVDLLAIAERREQKGAGNNSVAIGDSLYTAAQVRTAIRDIKDVVASIIGRPLKDECLSTHRAFVRAVHTSMRDGRRYQGIPFSYLVLNYDTLLEDALALEKIPFADGVEGGATGWWDPHSFSRPDREAWVFKLHGSVNWREFEGDALPRRLGANVRWQRAENEPILIWPAATKYRETRQDPFAQLSERAWKSLVSQRDEQKLLVISGYSFGDSHINQEISRALRDSDGRLTVAIFTSLRSPNEQPQLQEWFENADFRNDIRVYAKGGFFHGSTEQVCAEELSWWRFEELVHILGGR